MSEIIIKRIEKEEVEVMRVANTIIEKIDKCKKELYTVMPDYMKSLIINAIFEVNRCITDYENRIYSIKKCKSLSDCIDEVSFSRLCYEINEKISFIERCIFQKYNYNVAEDVRLWIKKIQDRIREYDATFVSTPDLRNQIEILEKFKDNLYITEFITYNANYSVVKEIYEYAEYFNYIESTNFSSKLRESDKLFLYIGTSVILEEFCDRLDVLNKCEESIRNAILEYISDIKMLNNIMEMRKEK